MKKILIPVDCVGCSTNAIDEGKKIAKAFGAEVVLLHVVSIGFTFFQYNADIPQESILTIIENEKVRVQEMLDDYKKSFKEIPVKVETVILEGTAAEEIVNYIKTSEIDLVIIGSKGEESNFKSNFMGNVTSKVIHYSEKPVLVVRLT
jgi:nucleotide-binding universal stress UspA family protein